MSKCDRGSQGGQEGLWIAKLIKVRGRKETDGYHLHETDLDELERPPPYLPPLKPDQTRIAAVGNKATYGGEVFNGPVGEDGGDDRSMFVADEYVADSNIATYGGVVMNTSMRPVDLHKREAMRMQNALKFCSHGIQG